MESLHDKIMNIGVVEATMPEDVVGMYRYKAGHRDARHAAAELASEHDDIAEELLEALELAHEHMKIWIPMYRDSQNVHDYIIGAIAKAKGE